MNETVTAEHKKPPRQKPPLGLARIAGEVVASAATGATTAAIAYLLFYVVGYGVEIAGLGEGCMPSLAHLVIWGIALWVVPLAYGLASAAGVYLVGSRGNETGSFLATLGGSLLGLFVMAILYFYIRTAEMYMMLRIEKTVLWPLVFLAVPITAVLCFNLTRRYKEPPSS